MLDFFYISIKKFDGIGKQFNFNIEGGKFKTFAGGFVSIFITLGVLTLAWYFGRDIYLRESPKFFKERTLRDYPPWEFNLTNDNMFLAYRLKYGNKTVDDMSEVEHIFRYKEKLFNNKTQEFITNIYLKKPVKCQIGRHVPKEVIERELVKEFFCVDEDMSLGGPDSVGSFTRAYFYLKFCNKDTEQRHNIKCKSKKELEKKYKDQKLFVEFYYQSNLVSPNTFKIPYKKAHYMIESGLDIFSKKALYQWVYYSKAEMNTDAGLVFDDMKSEFFIEFDDIRLTHEPANEDFNRDFFFKMMIFMSRHYTTYTRSYIKVPQILAMLGGFVNVSMIFINYLYGFYLDNEYAIFLYSKIFALKLDEEQNSAMEDQSQYDKINVKKNDEDDLKGVKIEEVKVNVPNFIINKNDISNNSNINASNNNLPGTPENLTKPKLYAKFLKNKDEDIILNKEINKLLKFKKKKRKEIQISKCKRFEFIHCYLEERSNHESNLGRAKLELMTQAERIIKKRSEIFEVWNVIDHVRLLKKLVLNENQCFMINNKGRQLLTSEGGPVTKEDLDKLDENEYQNSTNSLIEYFQKRKEENKANAVDILLYKYIEENLKKEVIKFVTID